MVKMKSEHLSVLFQQLFENVIQHNEKERKGIIEDQAKIFNLFYKEERNLKNEGTGIGLTVCKNIIDKYNGKIWFEKNQNGGTTFYMSLPAA